MTENTLPACPYCGKSDGFFIKAQAHGAVQLFYYEDGSEAEVGYDRLGFKHGQVVRCSACTHIRRDVQYSNRRIIARAEESK